MGFLKRIDNAHVDNSQKNKYISDSINQLNIARNLFKIDLINDSGKSDDNLAFLNPVQFIYRYLNSNIIENAIKKNPIVVSIIKNNGLSLKYELDNVSSIIASHLIPTARMANKMYLNYNPNSSSDLSLYLIQAALLHDLGKIFIPKKILNKKSKLSRHEREIIELHNKLSYEILKTTNLSKTVARLAGEHHDYDNSNKRTPENQILMIADIYCALREARPYRKALGDIAAKTILYDMGTQGKFDAAYINYLL